MDVFVYLMCLHLGVSGCQLATGCMSCQQNWAISKAEELVVQGIAEGLTWDRYEESFMAFDGTPFLKWSCPTTSLIGWAKIYINIQTRSLRFGQTHGCKVWLQRNGIRRIHTMRLRCAVRVRDWVWDSRIRKQAWKALRISWSLSFGLVICSFNMQQLGPLK